MVLTKIFEVHFLSVELYLYICIPTSFLILTIYIDRFTVDDVDKDF